MKKMSLLESLLAWTGEQPEQPCYVNEENQDALWEIWLKLNGPPTNEVTVRDELC